MQRSTAQARATYDRLARWYDLIEAPFERRARAAGLQLLDAKPGERILKIGFGTGHTLAALTRTLGTSGRLVGVDQSHRMAQRTRQRLKWSTERCQQFYCRPTPVTCRYATARSTPPR